MPNVNIPETENIKLVWTHQEKRRRRSLKKNDELESHAVVYHITVAAPSMDIYAGMGPIHTSHGYN